MSTSSLDAALALHRAGRFADAEAAYRTCIAAGDTDAAASLAVLLLQGGRYGEAADILQPLADAAPGNVEVAVNLSLALRREGRLGAARAAAERAARLAPDRPSAWNALGLAALDGGRPGDALEAFDAGLRVAPGHRALALHRAQCLQTLGRSADALKAFAALVREAPSLLDAWRGLAAVQSTLGHTAAAQQSRTRAVQLATRDAEAAFQRGTEQVKAGDGAAAVQTFRSLLQSDLLLASRCWFWLGRAHVTTGDIDAARASFAAAAAREPDNPVFAHFHSATTGRLPGTIENDYITSLFDEFADSFEQTLVGQLAYGTPQLLAGLLAQHGEDDAASVLDLGCGTGLMGAALARAGREIDGVDLSPRMLDHARAKGVYRELHAAELLAFLDAATARWDLIVAADVFVYVASLEPIIGSVLMRLAPGGTFAFSIERSDTDGTELSAATGRYRHAPARVCEALERAGFVDVVREDAVLRMESSAPVQGDLLFARRPRA